MNEDFEFLSLFVEDAMNGVDVVRRYPAYYQKLLGNPNLRQAFLDIIQLMEDDLNQVMESLPEPTRGNLKFLFDTSKSVTEAGLLKGWQTDWIRSIQQLQDIFSPPQLAYRSSSGLIDEDKFVILSDDFKLTDLRYTIAIECALIEYPQTGLSTQLNIGISSDKEMIQSGISLKATLKWGNYRESVIFEQAGRILLPSIPLEMIFDSSLERITSDLLLTIEAN